MLPEQVEGEADFLGRYVPLEEITNVRAGEAVRRSLERAEDLVGDGVAEGSAEDVSCGGVGILPDSKRRAQMRDANGRGSIERRIEQGKPYNLCFSARGQCAVKPWPSLGERRVELVPELSRRAVPVDPPFRRVGDRLAELMYKRGLSASVREPPSGSNFERRAAMKRKRFARPFAIAASVRRRRSSSRVM